MLPVEGLEGNVGICISWLSIRLQDHSESSVEPPRSSYILQTRIQIKEYCLSMVEFIHSNGVHSSLLLFIAGPVQADVLICSGQSIPEFA